MLKDLSYSRAVPNSKLKASFNLSNPFVNDDPEWRIKFRQTIQKRIHQCCSESDFKSRMHNSLNSFLGLHSKGIELPLFINTSVIYTFLDVFCDCDLSLLAPNDLIHLSNEIANTWVQSKSDNKLEPFSGDCLSRLLSTMDSGLKEIVKHNLLNLVLPGCDTLWRFILFYILSIYNSHEKLAAYKLATKEQNGLLFDAIIKQYPPAKSIYREKDGIIFVVDVVAINKEGENNLSFSTGERECPAKRKYVPMFVNYYTAWFIEYIEKSGLEAELMKISHKVELRELHQKNRVDLLKMTLIQLI